jgi:heterodisulfide reductase subunit A
VVLAVGILPNDGVASLFKTQELMLDPVGWIKAPEGDSSPMRTSIPGVFAAGTAIGPKDIPDSAVEGSGAAMESVAYLRRFCGKPVRAEKGDEPS